jgi:hypothetical protein
MSAEFTKASEAFARATAECAKAYSNATSDEERTAIEQLTDQLMVEHSRKVLAFLWVRIAGTLSGAGGLLRSARNAIDRPHPANIIGP